MRPVDKLSVFYRNRKVGELSMSKNNRYCAFRYDDEWLASGFSISPIELPLKADLFISDTEPFYGNFGIFEDSLPDGYGRHLLKIIMNKQQIDVDSLTPLQFLSI
ncbi:MAG: HipA N-terminal domain-containing protein, partial [Rikenellaceae bacterium]